MYSEVHGEGRPMALIEGLGTDMHPYMRRVELLSIEHNVLIFDSRGVGRAGKPDVPYAVEMMVDDTVALMKTVGIEKANVVDFSVCGRIAIALALRHPEMVRSLVLAPTTARARRKGLPSRLKFVKVLMSMGPFRDGRQPYYAFKRQLEVSRPLDCRARLTEVLAPAQILHGGNDKVVPLSLADELHTGIRNLEMKVFGGGHAFFSWDTEQFVGLCRDLWPPVEQPPLTLPFA